MGKVRNAIWSPDRTWSLSGAGGPGLLQLHFGHFDVEAVAEAADAADEGGTALLLDFLTQAKNVDVDRAIGHGAIVAPDGVKQLFPAEHHAGAAHEEFEQAVFVGGKD